MGAEPDKPVAPQTVSVDISTTSYVKWEGVVIRKNLPWALLCILELIVALYAFLLPQATT